LKSIILTISALVYLQVFPVWATPILQSEFDPNATVYDFSDQKYPLTIVSSEDLTITGGKVALTTHGPLTSPNYQILNNPITFSFDNPISALGMDVSFKSTNITLTLTLYNLSSGPVESFQFNDTNADYTEFIGLDYGSSDVVYARLSTSEPWDTWIDNITYQHSTAPVPEPGTLLLLGTGLVGLAGWRKKFGQV
jgi:hypothetical protein